MTILNETIARSLVANSSVPVVLRRYVNSWTICQWSLEKWSEVFGHKDFPFRCVNKSVQLHEPCWERHCIVRRKTFKHFIETALSSEDAMYFDYKYLHEWFSEEDELYKAISWKKFGFPAKGPIHSTLWVGNEGTHTPAHQDTYGVNIVTQLHGKKRWILFPPESVGLEPTRVPYEESSVYSGLNFFCPLDVEVFKGLSGAQVVDLSAGDALIVPHKWWHYVQNEDPVNISMNMWLPHENDKCARMSEALIKLFVAQMCKDLPTEDIKLLVNPNEDDLTDTPLSVLLSQVKAASSQYLDSEHPEHRTKRQKTEDDSTSDVYTEYDLDALINNPENEMEVPRTITGEALVKILEDTKNRYKCFQRPPQGNEKEANTGLCLSTVKNIINAFCLSNVVDQYKQNLSPYSS